MISKTETVLFSICIYDLNNIEPIITDAFTLVNSKYRLYSYIGRKEPIRRKAIHPYIHSAENYKIL